MYTEHEKKFLIGLEALTRETGVKISGCGCCGSPNLVEVELAELGEDSGYAGDAGFGDTVQWISKTDAYSWRAKSQYIVKGDSAWNRTKLIS